MTKHISGGSGELCEICYPTTPEMFAEYRELPPGPAWIPSNSAYDHPAQREWSKVPDGYTWQPATESTGAGWVRPKGKPPCPHDFSFSVKPGSVNCCKLCGAGPYDGWI